MTNQKDSVLVGVTNDGHVALAISDKDKCLSINMSIQRAQYLHTRVGLAITEAKTITAHIGTAEHELKSKGQT